jgi:hypothetical protein
VTVSHQQHTASLTGTPFAEVSCVEIVGVKDVIFVVEVVLFKGGKGGGGERRKGHTSLEDKRDESREYITRSQTLNNEAAELISLKTACFPTINH